ncbi:PqqD family protein [Sphingobacterium shayense]|uniref:PqqD family protein n=1 Tax=Sphingobacterium shayense TaxID=626343 RepID=UPI001551B9D9|nr:PqqD family protein [Sphingobacterium shayense]NQD70247.1 PqqD family protein [Sphingobacterium shayense]
MKLRSDISLRKVGNEYIIVEPSQGMVDLSKVFTLNETAAFLWEELKGKEFMDSDLVQLLLDNYEVEEGQAKVDASILLQTFREQGLLVS